MVAPDNWAAPASGGTVTASSRWSWVGYLDGTWVALTTEGISRNNRTYVRWTTEPEGDWQTHEITTLDPGGEFDLSLQGFNGPTRIAYNGSYYYFTSPMADSSTGSLYSSYAVYSSSLNGTWQAANITGSAGTASTPRHIYNDFRYINGEFVGVGFTTNIGTNQEARIASSASLLDTQTADFTDATISFCRSIDFDGTNYVRIYRRGSSPTTASVIQYSTSLASGWTDVSPAFTNGSYFDHQRSFVRYINGHWVAAIEDSSGYPVLAYASDPTATWGTVSPADLGMNLTTNYIWDIAYGGGYWVIVGGQVGTTTGKRISYLAAGVNESPDGTYTQVTTGLSSSNRVLPSIAYGDGCFVLVSDLGNIRYSRILPPAPTGPSLLRQRQSPKRTPSRVRGADLRQRQTPYIR